MRPTRATNKTDGQQQSRATTCREMVRRGKDSKSTSTPIRRKTLPSQAAILASFRRSLRLAFSCERPQVRKVYGGPHHPTSLKHPNLKRCRTSPECLSSGLRRNLPRGGPTDYRHSPDDRPYRHALPAVGNNRARHGSRVRIAAGGRREVVRVKAHDPQPGLLVDLHAAVGHVRHDEFFVRDLQ